MGLSFLPLQDASFLFLLLDLAFHCLQLHSFVVLIDFLADLCSFTIVLAILLQSLDSLDFGVILHNVALLLGHICRGQVFKGHVASCQHALSVV